MIGVLPPHARGAVGWPSANCGLQPPLYATSANHPANAASISACAWHDAMVVSVGVVKKGVVAGVTVNVAL